MKKIKKEEETKVQRKKNNFSSRKASMQEIYEQVISEDPENEESLNSSESEEIGISEKNVKKPGHGIAKLQLEKIVDKTHDKVSCEKWTTKPGSVTELLFEEIIQFYEIEENIEKENYQKYEHVVKLIKAKENERKKLLVANQELIEKIKNIELENSQLKVKNCELEIEVKKKINDFEKSVNESNKIVIEINNKNEILSKELINSKENAREKENLYLDKIKELEEEARHSSRLNYSCSFDSDYAYFTQEHTEFVYSKLKDNGELIVPKQVGEYINQLLQKISKLVSKTKKLRLQRENLKNILESIKSKEKLKT